MPFAKAFIVWHTPKHMNKGSLVKTARLTREEIAHALLGRIVSGQYPPGQPLPGQARLRPEFGRNVSMSTLNAAVRILKDNGFLVVRQRHSTCVANPIPYRNRYAITLPNLPDPSHPTTLYSVLHRIAMDRQRDGGEYEYTVFSGTNEIHEHDAVLSALAREIHWHRVAGVLFASELWGKVDDPILHEPGIARASLSNWKSDVAMPPMPQITFNESSPLSFRARGTAWLRENGCRTVAVILYGQPPIDPDAEQRTALWEPWRKALAAAGLTTQPHWLHSLNGGGYEIGLLLMHGRETPDAVVITDDILVPSVTAGLRAAGPPCPKVLALANYPVLPHTHVPTRFLGHDIEALFDRCAASLRNSEEQHTCPAFPIPAVFEDEWRQGKRI